MKLARFTRDARAELLAQIKYYEAIRAGLGTRFRAEVEATARLAAAFPRHGKPGLADTRRRLVPTFPFKLIYTETPDGILIHAVAADHQLPGHWLTRVPPRNE